MGSTRLGSLARERPLLPACTGSPLLRVLGLDLVEATPLQLCEHWCHEPLQGARRSSISGSLVGVQRNT